jgi:hypothetical protein
MKYIVGTVRGFQKSDVAFILPLLLLVLRWLSYQAVGDILCAQPLDGEFVYSLRSQAGDDLLNQEQQSGLTAIAPPH